MIPEFSQAHNSITYIKVNTCFACLKFLSRLCSDFIRFLFNLICMNFIFLNGKKLKLVELIDFPKDLKFIDEKFGNLIFFDEFVHQIYETQI